LACGGRRLLGRISGNSSGSESRISLRIRYTLPRKCLPRTIIIPISSKDIFEDPVYFTEKVFATYDNNTYIEHFVCHIVPDSEREDRWLEHWSQPILSGLYAGGRIEHYNDITERKKAEEKLIPLLAVVKQSSEGMAVANLDGILTFANNAWCKMHGYKSSKELLGKNLAIFHNKEQLENEVKPFNEKVKQDGAHSGDWAYNQGWEPISDFNGNDPIERRAG